MKVSLIEFLRTGVLGDIYVGISEDQVLALIGIPDGVEAPSRKRRAPSILKYGDVQLYFSNYPERICSRISVSGWKENDRFLFPNAWLVKDWDLLPSCDREAAEKYLVIAEIVYDVVVKEHFGAVLKVKSSNTTINFTDEGELWSIASSV